jgi:predicted ATPase
MILLPLVLWPIGDIELSRRLADEAVAQALASRLISSVMVAQFYKIGFEAIRSDAVRAAPHIEALRNLSQEHGIPLWLHFASLFEGWTLWHMGDREAGLATMREGLARWRDQELTLFLPLGVFLLAQAKVQGGQLVEGLEMFPGR